METEEIEADHRQVEGRGSTKGIPDFVILLIRGVMYNNKALFLILK